MEVDVRHRRGKIQGRGMVQARHLGEHPAIGEENLENR